MPRKCMKRILMVLLAVLIPSTSFAGLPFKATLEEMAEGADHILIGRIIGVDMINSRGEAVLDRESSDWPRAR